MNLADRITDARAKLARIEDEPRHKTLARRYLRAIEQWERDLAKEQAQAQGLKRCTTCKRALPLETFGPNRTTHDRLNAACRPCNRTHAREGMRRLRARRREAGVPLDTPGDSAELVAAEVSTVLAKRDARVAVCTKCGRQGPVDVTFGRTKKGAPCKRCKKCRGKR